MHPRRAAATATLVAAALLLVFASSGAAAPWPSALRPLRNAVAGAGGSRTAVSEPPRLDVSASTLHAVGIPAVVSREATTAASANAAAAAAVGSVAAATAASASSVATAAAAAAATSASAASTASATSAVSASVAAVAAAPIPIAAAEPPAPPPAALSVDCALVRALAASSPSVAADPANLRALLPLCDDPSGFGARQLAYRECAGFGGRLAELAGRADGVLEEAFVGFVSGAGGANFAALATEAVAAAHEASARPVVLFAAGAIGEGASAASHWPPSRFPRLAVLCMPPGELHPWFDKLRAALFAPVQRAVVFEADSLATRHVDRLFALIAREPRYEYPVLPVHMHLRWPDCEVRDGVGVTTVALVEGDARRHACGAPFPVPLAERSTHYGHAHFLATSAAKAFLADVVLACSSSNGGSAGAAGAGGDGGGVSPLRNIDCGSDESALNSALWQRGARRQACLFDPIFDVFEAWAQQSWGAETGIAAHRRESWSTHSAAFAFLHGAKDPTTARVLAARARALPAGAAWVSHRGEWVELGAGDAPWRGADGCEL